METTTNYGLKKPAGSDYYNIEDFNGNADILDATLHDHEADQDNPHGVTAAQVGAMPTTGGTFTGDVNISSGKQIMIGGKETGTDHYLRWNGYGGTNWWGFHRYIDTDTGNTVFGLAISTASGTTHIFTCPSNTKAVTFTNAIVNGSDRRLKSDIADMQHAKELIMRLSPKQFRMNSDDSGKTNYGFIAQDVQEAMSALGIEDSSLVIDSGNIDNIEHALGLSYTQLIAPMVSVIQEQEQRIAALEERLDRLEQSL